MRLQAVCSTSFSEEPISFKWIIHNAETTLIRSSLQLRSSHFPGTKTIKNCQLLVQWVKDNAEKLQPAKLVLTLYFSHSMRVLITDLYFTLSDCSCQKIVKVANSIKDINVTHRNPIAISSQTGNIIIPGNEPIKNFLCKKAMTLMVTANIVNLSPNQSFLSSVMIPKNTLCENMMKMFRACRFTDLTLLAGDKRYSVHKVVIGSQSEIIKRMIPSDLTEGNFRVPGIAMDVMEDLLTYFYTGTVPHIKTLSGSLLLVADKYRVPHLRMISERNLLTTLTHSNVTSVLLLSDKVSHDNNFSLRSACVEYFKAHLVSVIKSDDYVRNAGDISQELLSLLFI